MLPNEITINRDDVVGIVQNIDGSTIIKAVIDPRRGYAFRGNKKHLLRKIEKLPKKYIINKGATILFWNNGDKTVVKRTQDDEYNKVLGFLWAYFQYTSGLSKTQANEYLKGLVDADDLKAIELIKSGKLNETMSNVAEGLSKALKDMADSFNNRNK